MRASRLLLLLCASLLAVPTPASRAAGSTLVLEEVRNHLNEAQKNFDKGTFDLAMAHADMVLVSDEIKVSYVFQNVPDNIRPSALKAMEQALETWETALSRTIRFEMVASPEAADVQIRFKPDVRMGREPVAGFANWKRVITTEDDGRVHAKFTADLQIRTMTLSWKPMSLEAMRHEIMHEIGHVLGLEDCDNSGDIMGPLDMSKPVAAPRPYEVQAVLDIRRHASRIRREARAQVFKSGT
jgi:predicted Zn-dependent protease